MPRTLCHHKLIAGRLRTRRSVLNPRMNFAMPRAHRRKLQRERQRRYTVEEFSKGASKAEGVGMFAQGADAKRDVLLERDAEFLGAFAHVVA